LKTFILILLLFSSLVVAADYPLKDGKPTSKGIELYIEEMADSIVMEFMAFVDDTIYNLYIYAEDLTDYGIHDSLELGRYYSHEIYITTAESFEAYELDDLPKWKQNSLDECNKFVKAALLHEICHEYTNQLAIEMRSIDGIRVDPAYQTNIWIIMSYETFGSTFIEEGICEYLIEKMGEILPPKKPEIPRTVDELTNNENRYKFVYKFSAHFLTEFLDSAGIKKGIKVLLHNSPPTYEEILDPPRYFDRLKYPF
jgi:hypothetical protein